MDRVVQAVVDGQARELHILEALRVRAQETYPEVVAEYVEAIEAGAVFPPVKAVVTHFGLTLVDGRHRIAAWEQLGLPIHTVVGADGDHVLLVAIQANVRHGERRRFGDVRRCVELALEYWGHESNREIARMVKCSHTYVNTIREELAAGGGHVSTSKTLEGSASEKSSTPSAPAWQSPWTPESFQVVDEFEAQGEFATVDQTTTSSVKVAPVFVNEAPSPEAAWVEDAERELAGMGPGRVLLASGEVEVPVAREVKRHRGQDPLERWYTDPALATVCWRWLLESRLLKDVPQTIGAPLRCLEPCVGGGAWVSGLEAALAGLGGSLVQASWVVMDADPQAPGLRLWKDRVAESVVGDFLTTPWEGWKFDVVISNPPNSRAQEVVEESIRRLDWHGVAAFLLPASWMAAKRRRGWLSLNPPRVVALVPWRPSFEGPAAELQGTGEGSPTQDYALHVWVNGDPPGRTWTGTWMEDTSEVKDGEE